MLPDWPAGTVAILVTLGDAPHAIPVSTALRAGPDRILLALADGRGSLARLQRDPRVAVALVAAGLAVTARGRARVLDAPVSDGVTGVEVTVDALDDHLRSTFELEAGVRWHWTDADSKDRDEAVRAAVARLATDG
ncbi:MAG: hypothetical protein QOF83_2021 [Solirubrobacteraceae bacterium]|jgi:hypothetical protein|nr:hypothetical protein [Solirubrobacteraceae bacterium]